MSPNNIHIENIDQVIKFRKKLEDLNDETKRDIYYLSSKYADLPIGRDDVNRRRFDEKVTLMSDFLIIYSRTLEEHIESLKKVEKAVQEYMDAGR